MVLITGVQAILLDFVDDFLLRISKASGIERLPFILTPFALVQDQPVVLLFRISMYIFLSFVSLEARMGGWGDDALDARLDTLDGREEKMVMVY